MAKISISARTVVTKDDILSGKQTKGRHGLDMFTVQYMEVRRKLAAHKTALLTRSLTDAPAQCRITLREWMMHWMENEVSGSVKTSSYQTYLTQINKHILPALDGLYLTQFIISEKSNSSSLPVVSSRPIISSAR